MAAVKYAVSMSSEQYGHEEFGTHEKAEDALAQAGRLVAAATTAVADNLIARDIHISVLPATECGNPDA